MPCSLSPNNREEWQESHCPRQNGRRRSGVVEAGRTVEMDTSVEIEDESKEAQ